MLRLVTDRPAPVMIDFARSLSDEQFQLINPREQSLDQILNLVNPEDMIVWDAHTSPDLKLLNALLQATSNVVFVLARKFSRKRRVGVFVRGRANTILFRKVEDALRSARLISQTRVINLYKPQASEFEETKLDFDRMFLAENVDEVSFIPVPAEGDVWAKVEELVEDLDLAVFGLPSAVPETHFLAKIMQRWSSRAIDADLVFVRSVAPVDTAEYSTAFDLFVRNTYPAGYFDPKALVEVKRNKGISISLVLPTLNEEKTLPGVIEAFIPLQKDLGLLDRILVVDSGSKDTSLEIARSYGLETYVHQRVRPELGAYVGKGEALWKSLFATDEDIVVFMDTDLMNPHSDMIAALLGPLLIRDDILLVKGFFHRGGGAVEKLQAGGGRVTEIAARPLINLFAPNLSFLFQPLAGPTAARRNLLLKIPFYTGYGVEIGMLLATERLYGAKSVAQADIGELVHRNQPVEALTRMSVEVLQAMLDILELRPAREDLLRDNLVYTLLSERRYALLPRTVKQAKRPPAATLLGLL